MHRTTAQKIRTNFKTRQAYLLQHSNSKAPVELEPKFGPFIHNTKPTDYNTATARLQRAGTKIWSYCTQDKAYTLQHSYSKAPVKLEPKFGPFIHNTKPTDYNTATARLQRSWNQNLVILYTRQSLHPTTQLLQGSSEAGAKIWSYCTQDKAYTLQHSYSKAPVKLEPKFGNIVHKTKPTHYNKATPRLQ